MKDPIIIIGAGRSGTNALRDSLTSIDQFSTWPCDEINYVWRAGNRSTSTDELTPSHANTEAKRVIPRAFEQRAGKNPETRLVEKTCANSLRVGFVNEVIPEARFVHILRDGRDVASSAMSRWTAPLDIMYIAKKARFVPRRDLLFYAQRYLRSRLERRKSDDARLSTWGPRFDGLDEMVAAGTPLDAVCAEQWARCVTASLDQLSLVDNDRVLTVHYDEFVHSPVEVLRRIVAFAGEVVSDEALALAGSSIHAGSTQSWSRRLTAEQIERVTSIVEPVNDRIARLR